MRVRVVIPFYEDTLTLSEGVSIVLRNMTALRLSEIVNDEVRVRAEAFYMHLCKEPTNPYAVAQANYIRYAVTTDDAEQERRRKETHDNTRNKQGR
jgi:acyl-ACP thioesterase